MIFVLPDLDAMARFGRQIARRLEAGDVVALEGGLGAGKTTLARAIIAALGHTGEVPSPTFTIIETYDDTRLPVVHADFYRLERPEEVEQLGLDDYREGAVLIAEWPGNAGGFADEAQCLSIILENLGKNAEEGRKAIVECDAAWQSRWP